MYILPSTFRTIATQYLNSSFPEPRRSTLVTDRVFKAHFKLGPTATAQVWYKLGEVHRDADSVYSTTDDPPQVQLVSVTDALRTPRSAQTLGAIASQLENVETLVKL